MSNQQQLTEAIWALTNELRLFREQLPAVPTTEPSHTGAAPVTSGEFEVGDWVRVDEPRSEWHGMAGRIRSNLPFCSIVDFPNMQMATLHHNSLEPAPKPDPTTPRH